MMVKIGLLVAAGLALACVATGCALSYPGGTGIKPSITQDVQAQSLKGDIQELIDRALARDDVMMGEAGKAQGVAEQGRLTKQAYYEAFGTVSRVRDRAGGVGLNPFEARKKKAILTESEDTLWKLRYLEKDGGSKAGDDDARLALYERLHSEAVGSLNRVATLLKSK